ncbi:MAG: prephenate dehydratase domain-containing protein, partial [Deltaproteobacteria bacterium]
MDPKTIQKRIEKNDRELLVLLQERIGLALHEKRIRRGRDDPPRKNDLPTRAPCLNHNLIQESITHRLLETIANAIKQWEEEDQPLTAFQGEHGAYSEVAARKLVPDGAFLPCHEFGQVFRGVENGNFDLGVVPVENSLEGAVTHVNDLLTT